MAIDNTDTFLYRISNRRLRTDTTQSIVLKQGWRKFCYADSYNTFVNRGLILVKLIACFCFTALFLGYVFSDGLSYMVDEWSRDEYSHGYIIPLISFWVAWENRESIKASLGHGSWVGVLFVLAGLLLGFLGKELTCPGLWKWQYGSE